MLSLSPVRRVGLALALAAAMHCATHAQVDVYAAGRIWTGDADPVKDAVLVVANGKIVAVGPRKTTDVPDGARLHDLGRAVIIPGLVVAQTQLAQAADTERALTPEMSALGGFDFFAESLPPKNHSVLVWHFDLEPLDTDPVGLIDRARGLQAELARDEAADAANDEASPADPAAVPSDASGGADAVASEST